MVLAKDLTPWFISGLSKAAGAEVVLPLGVVCLPTPMTDDLTVPRYDLEKDMRPIPFRCMMAS